MPLTNAEFEALLEDPSKRIDGDVSWSPDEDHSPTVEFRAEILSDSGHPLFVKGSYNPLVPAITFALIHRNAGRIYGLDLGKDHHNPTCQNVGETHKHRWTENFRDKEAYVPQDITAEFSDPTRAWQQFCDEAHIRHNGVLDAPPPMQEDLFA